MRTCLSVRQSLFYSDFINIYDDDNIIATTSTSIVIGDPILFVSDQFNVESGWTVGSLDDDVYITSMDAANVREAEKSFGVLSNCRVMLLLQ